MDTGVYCWLNKVNGKRYVGSSAISLKGRKEGHLKLLRKKGHYNRHLQAAWNKYGEEQFDFDVLCYCEPEECVTQEQAWIDHYQAANDKYGYNLSPTAGSVLGVPRPDVVERNKQPETVRAFLNGHKKYMSGIGRLKAQETMRKLHQQPGFTKRTSEAAVAASVRKTKEEGRTEKQQEADLINMRKATQASIAKKRRLRELTGEPYASEEEKQRIRERNANNSRSLWSRITGTPEEALLKLRMAWGRYGKGMTLKEYAEAKKPELLKYLN